MRLLLDTHVILWSLLSPERLSRRALAELETLVKLNPLTPYLPDVTLLMARAHRKLGNPDKARELIRKVLDEYPKSRAAQQAIKEM